MLLNTSNFTIFRDNNAFKNYKHDVSSYKRTDDDLAKIKNLTDNQTNYEDAGQREVLGVKVLRGL